MQTTQDRTGCHRILADALKSVRSANCILWVVGKRVYAAVNRGGYSAELEQAGWALAVDGLKDASRCYVYEAAVDDPDLEGKYAAFNRASTTVKFPEVRQKS